MLWFACQIMAFFRVRCGSEKLLLTTIGKPDDLSSPPSR